MDHCVVKKWDEDRCVDNTEGTWRKKEEERGLRKKSERAEETVAWK